jgi:hydroxyacylglutathione hydrolase
VAICALKMRARDDASDDEAHEQEVEEAYGLFTGSAEAPAITLAHLRRVAAVLKEEVDEELLRDMILEANGGAGVGHGVKKDEFDRVMARAGVWR